MSTLSHLAAEALAAILLADRPAGLPDSVAIQTASSTEDLVRPVLLIATEGFQDLHPRLTRGNLILELHTRADEDPAEDAATWHAAAVDYLRENPAALYATLHPHGYRLTACTPSAATEEPDSDRGRIHSRGFTICAEKI